MIDALRQVPNLCRVGLVATLALMLSSCDNGAGAGIVEIDPASGVMQISPPQYFSERGINSDQVFPRVTINGNSINMREQGNSGIWQASVTIPEGDDVNLMVEWIEFFNNRDLLLTVAEKLFPAISQNIAVTLFEDDYVDDDFVTYPLLDADSDNVSNFAERTEGSDPVSAADPGTTRANVFVHALNWASAQSIDGSYEQEWSDAQWRDRDDELLHMDNRMVGFDPLRPDGSTEYRYGVFHDNQYLYLFVLGEKAENRISHGDSLQAWHDDAIDIFIDGNRSQGTSYDGVDDYHMIFPLLKYNTGDRNRSHISLDELDLAGRYETGTNSAPVIDADGIRFAMCMCPNGDTYEIRLDLQKFGIPVGRSFGFDVQINDDVDGDTREYKFGWQAPSAAPNVFARDETWENPSLMGLMYLLPSD